MACDGTEVPAGADDYPGLDVVVHDPSVTVTAKGSKRGSVDDPGSGSTQQEIVELAAADGVADGGRVASVEQLPADDAGSEAPDLLNRESRGLVVFRIEIEQAEHRRCEPTRADLVTREACPIDHDDVPSRPGQRAGAGRSRWSTAGDERVTADHATAPGVWCGADRVHDGGGDSRGVNTIWNSCIQPVAKAACEPARYSSQARWNSWP